MDSSSQPSGQSNREPDKNVQEIHMQQTFGNNKKPLPALEKHDYQDNNKLFCLGNRGSFGNDALGKKRHSKRQSTISQQVPLMSQGRAESSIVDDDSQEENLTQRPCQGYIDTQVIDNQNLNDEQQNRKSELRNETTEQLIEPTIAFDKYGSQNSNSNMINYNMELTKSYLNDKKQGCDDSQEVMLIIEQPEGGVSLDGKDAQYNGLSSKQMNGKVKQHDKAMNDQSLLHGQNSFSNMVKVRKDMEFDDDDYYENDIQEMERDSTQNNDCTPKFNKLSFTLNIPDRKKSQTDVNKINKIDKRQSASSNDYDNKNKSSYRQISTREMKLTDQIKRIRHKQSSQEFQKKYTQNYDVKKQKYLKSLNKSQKMDEQGVADLDKSSKSYNSKQEKSFRNVKVMERSPRTRLPPIKNTVKSYEVNLNQIKPPSSFKLKKTKTFTEFNNTLWNETKTLHEEEKSKPIPISTKNLNADDKFKAQMNTLSMEGPQNEKSIEENKSPHSPELKSPLSLTDKQQSETQVTINQPQVIDQNDLGNFDDFDEIKLANKDKDKMLKKGKSKEKIKLMTEYGNKKFCIIYPENTKKGYWDLFITLILLISCFSTPYIIAFSDAEMGQMNNTKIFEYVIDCLFLVDILIIFNTAYYNPNFDMIDQRKTIACNYLHGWFTIDFIAIVPFDYVLSLGNFNVKMMRVVRVGRLYKLVKLTRLLRILKLVKDKNKLMKYLNDLLKVGLGFERLFFFFLISIIVVHIVSCLWIIVASLQHEQYIDTWIQSIDAHEQDTASLYIISLYWTCTTFTTVGYGDISGTTNIEMIFCSIMMIIGVVAFSYANGTLSSIIQNYDQTNAEFADRLMILNRIYKEYCLPLDLYIRLQRNLNFEIKKDFHEINRFVENLPHKLRIEVSLHIYEERYNQIRAFRKMTPSFLSWICPLMKPQCYSDNQHLFFEGDEVQCIYFQVSGASGFVLPAFDNVKYIDIRVGDRFGIIDITGSAQENEIKEDEWYQNRNKLQRQFTIMSIKLSEFLILELQTLHDMEQEFNVAYKNLFADSNEILMKCLQFKLEAMSKCEEQKSQFEEEELELEEQKNIKQFKKHDTFLQRTMTMAIGPVMDSNINKPKKNEYKLQSFQLQKIEHIITHEKNAKKHQEGDNQDSSQSLTSSEDSSESQDSSFQSSILDDEKAERQTNEKSMGLSLSPTKSNKASNKSKSPQMARRKTVNKAHLISQVSKKPQGKHSQDKSKQSGMDLLKKLQQSFQQDADGNGGQYKHGGIQTKALQGMTFLQKLEHLSKLLTQIQEKRKQEEEEAKKAAEEEQKKVEEAKLLEQQQKAKEENQNSPNSNPIRLQPMLYSQQMSAPMEIGEGAQFVQVADITKQLTALTSLVNNLHEKQQQQIAAQDAKQEQYHQNFLKFEEKVLWELSEVRRKSSRRPSMNPDSDANFESHFDFLQVSKKDQGN